MESKLFTEELPNINFEMEFDEAQLEMRSAGGPLLESEVKLMATKASKLLLSQAKVAHFWAGQEGRSLTELTFQLDAVLDQDCVISQLIFSISFAEDGECRVEDMQPETVTGKDPVKQNTSYKGGLKLEWGNLKLGPSAEIEKSEEKNIYYPEIIAHGKTYDFASWHFRGKESKILDVNKEFRVLFTRSNAIAQLRVNYLIEADIRYANWAGNIPLIGKKSIMMATSQNI